MGFIHNTPGPANTFKAKTKKREEQRLAHVTHMREENRDLAVDTWTRPPSRNLYMKATQAFGTEEGLGPPVEKMWGSLR